MKRSLSLILVLALTCAVRAQDKPAETSPEKKDAQATAAKDEKKKHETDAKAREILKQADEATKNAPAVRYDFDFRATGAIESRAPKGKGTVILSGKVKNPTDFFAKARFEIKMQPPGSSDEMEYTVVTDGDKFALIDPKAKKIYEDIDPSVLGRRGSVIQNFGMREYSHPQPFSDEIKGDYVELRGEKDIGGEKCHEIHVIYAGGQGEAVWFFSVKDHLPRRVERLNLAGPGSGSTELELHNLSVDPKFTVDPFTVVVPEGFTKTDDPAP